jgi:xanthine dehydrogenase accessory factor
VDLAILQKLNAARRDRQATILVTETASGAVRLVIEKDGYDGDLLQEELAARFRSGASGAVTTPSGESYFLTTQLPPPRLVVIGAVHISQALAPMAKIAGFDMTIIDPRTAFATPERFPDVPLLAEWPDVALPKIGGLDAFTGLAVVTHDPKIDDFPLAEALRANCFYVGALGSRKTHGKRLERLRALGIDDNQLASIHAPIGMPISAQSPAEIAVAVLAEIISALRTRGKQLREAAA